MTIILTDAAHDENGKDGYEKHLYGDQTGDEVRNITYSKTGSFWNSSKTVVFRCMRPDIREAYTIRMQQACDNHHVGYGQPARRMFYDQMAADPDPSHIAADIDVDCSCLVNTCVWATYNSMNHPETGKVYPLARTIDMPAMYSKLSDFKDITNGVNLATGSGLQRGDILVIPNSHTAVVYNVIEDQAEPEIKYRKAVTTTELYMRTAPSVLAQRCNIQMRDDMVIRNYLYKAEPVKVIGEKDNWCQILVEGVHTWTPWCSKKYLVFVD